MTRSRSLDPGTSIARYRVVSLLGAGGMGEVYLARDESLDRSVALKILPPDLVRNDERVRRFVQEAKSASSLNHPHIVTIYEIGEAEIGGGDGAPAEKIQFIAMELVSGHTLKTLIHQGKTDLRTLVRYLAQAADGLAKAHAAGIVHRDLKPENIMVTSDGFAKVVDFGLAKLTETATSGTDLTSAPTALAKATGAGMILGTVGYMSPEQVQGKTVDHRSDIFSLGCVLYEAATRQRPFQADSDIETLHKILKERPQPIEEINPDVPGELRRLIRRCLAKSPDQRRHAMKDLALDLAEIADEYETLSASSGAGSRVSSSVIGEAPVGRKARTLVAAALTIGVLGLAAGAWSVWRAWTSSAGTGTPLERMTVTRLMSSPDIGEVMLSPDGRQLVYTKTQGSQTTLWMRQVATASDIQIQINPAPRTLRNVSFSADGNYLFFVASDNVVRDVSGSWNLYQIPALGGSARRLAGPFSNLDGLWVSPDGRRMVMIRYDPSTLAATLLAADISGNGERTLATYGPFETAYAAAWSPDGETLAVASDALTGGRWVVTLTAMTVANGQKKAIGTTRWRDVGSLAWLGDGRGLIMTAVPDGTEERQDTRQVWTVAYPEGEARRVTNDANSYLGASLSADGTALVTTQTRSRSRAWMAEAGNLTAPQELNIATEGELSGFAAAGPAMLFATYQGDRGTVWTIREDGTGARPLTPDSLQATLPAVSTKAGIAVFQASQSGDIYHLWRMDLDGGNLRQISSGEGEYVRALSPDGSTVLFTKYLDYRTIWRMPSNGGDATKFLDDARDVAYSSDGQRLLVWQQRQEGGRELNTLVVIPASGGSPLETWEPLPDSYGFKWAPEGNAVDFVRDVDGVRNLWRTPIGGGTPRQLTTLKADILTRAEWTTDAKRLFYVVRETVSRDVLMIKNFR